MNHDTMAGNWKQIEGKVRAKWGKLTDNDLEVIGGNKDVLVGKLQERYGHKKDEAEKNVHEFYDQISTDPAKPLLTTDPTR